LTAVLRHFDRAVSLGAVLLLPLIRGRLGGGIAENSVS